MGMKHVRDAQNLLDSGDSAGALSVLENLLDLAPRNPDALRMKAGILDGWGRFDDSLIVMHALSQIPNLSDECVADLEQRAMEEKEAVVYSELSQDGRWYFAFPRAQIWISLFGFLGCAVFLLLSPNLLSEGTDRLADMVAAFALFVVVPWVALMVVHVFGIKRILVGMQGIRVCTRFKETNLPWDRVKAAVVEYDLNINSKHLKVLIYTKESPKTPLFIFDISRKHSVVKARRHLLRNILGYVDTVCYLPKNSGLPESSFDHPEKTGTPDSPQSQPQHKTDAGQAA